MIVTAEFVKYFDICNDYVTDKYDKPSKEFYEMKNLFLREYCCFDGYDLQVYGKYSIYDHQIGEVCGGLDWKYAAHCHNRGECTEPRLESTHYNILERYEVRFKSIRPGYTESKIYHIPTNEFKFKTVRGYRKESERFESLERECENTLEGRKYFKVKRKPPKPGEALAWLKQYFEENNIIHKQIEIFETIKI